MPETVSLEFPNEGYHGWCTRCELIPKNERVNSVYTCFELQEPKGYCRRAKRCFAFRKRTEIDAQPATRILLLSCSVAGADGMFASLRGDLPRLAQLNQKP